MKEQQLISRILWYVDSYSLLNIIPCLHQVSACLNVIGSKDVRPRIGAVINVDNKPGTIFKVTQKGKLCVQLHNSLDTKKVSLYDLKIIPQIMFNLERMPFNENLIKTWAILTLIKQFNVFNNHDKKAIYGQINLSYLRNQQNMLSVINATKVLQTDQNKLRKILKYPVSSLDQYHEQWQHPEEEANHSNLVIQKLLSIATQPSPLKPCFSLDEMQLAALNLSQYLAAESMFDKLNSPVSGSEKAIISKTPIKENNSELPTPNSEYSIKSVVSEKKKKKQEEAALEPVNPIVAQIIEMGFTKKSVESAMKAIGEYVEY